ncbi:hypothetical protein DPSP01_012521 [Paraphaeosphaeria sporulosa]|uniref:Uncharacterized protein n=1 Tax=Paraphaeosphaeria sporulosa TaxID=1460663 RepID=A0A177BY94_9PLEO|nr:uncharacterized protein CC84DRAFT_1210251 [Paraphaeosphaeria sporulosa]OAF99376.1 hypothetical protein CC84DRAFT_1210251 [Paraphaeosphaeria sporulosa]
MSFGFSPSDVVKLVQVSTRVYLAFKDANDNSETQVSGLVREFSSFHQCLLELSELMNEYGKPLPFPYLDFQETLQRCEETIEPYANHLVDRKMSMKKFVYTIRYIGKEKEIANLRTVIMGHYQALQMCTSFLQLRLHLEATKQTQRLLDLAPFRSVSFGGHAYTTNTIGSSSRTAPNALPAPSEADQLYKDWLIFSRWLKNEDERLAIENGSSARPSSWGATPAATQNGDEQTAAVLYHLRRELEDAIMIEENRAKRLAIERRTNLAPSDAIRQEMRNLPHIPQRTGTIQTLNSDSMASLAGLDARNSMGDSMHTLRPSLTTPSPCASPTGSPQVPQSYFDTVDWGSVSEAPSSPGARTSSMSSFSQSPESRRSAPGLGISTAGTTPEDAARPLRRKLSAASLLSIALGPGALQWNKLCRKAMVERVTAQGSESRECDLHWRYREDAGISIRSVYRSGTSKEVKVWITQHFPATGPSIPLTTSFPDGDVAIDFPRHSHGRLEKRCIDVKYLMSEAASSDKLQTLLYTNNGKEGAELLYDRPVLSISSNLNKPECRGKNLRLWRKTEVRVGPNGLESADVLILLFYTSALPGEKAHWVEEPHYVFQWLDESAYSKSSDKLQLVFSKEPGKWTRDKVFQRRKSSKSSEQEGDSGRPGLSRAGTRSSIVSSSAVSVTSVRSSIFSSGQRKGAAANLNRFGYSELEVKFQSKADRGAFLEIWKKYVKGLV